MTTFCLPDLGEGLAEAEIIAWHVSEGDRVVADQPLVSVETDKAVVEIPAPRSGTLTRIHARAGAVIPVGAPLADIGKGHRKDAGAIVGKLEPEQPPPHPAPADAPPPPRRAQAAPVVRARARALGLELADLTGTGPGGTITMADLEAAVSGRVLRGPRRTMARRMAEAGAQVVHAHIFDEADIEDWETRETITARLVRAIAGAARAEPGLNAHFDAAALVRTPHNALHLGIALDTEDGLLVPVLHNAQTLDGEAIDARLRQIEDAGRARAFEPKDFQGATITVSNFGAIGGRFAAMVVVPPQVAIVGAGRAAQRVVPGREGPETRWGLPLSLSFDHRAVTGGEAARFLRALLEDLGKPV